MFNKSINALVFIRLSNLLLGRLGKTGATADVRLQYNTNYTSDACLGISEENVFQELAPAMTSLQRNLRQQVTCDIEHITIKHWKQNHENRDEQLIVAYNLVIERLPN